MKKRIHYLIESYKSRSNRYLIGALALYVLMLFLASIRPLERTLIGMFNDKLLHVLVYMAISSLLYLGLRLEFFIERLLATMGIVALLAAFDELLQLGSSHRIADFEDWLYDMVGAVFVLMAILAYRTAIKLYRDQQDPEID